ncbi:MAG TPA: hypothetical protein VGA80_14180 [Flavobacteriaceae bacterium]
MTWVKQGLIFNVNGEHDWNKSHAQLPIVDVNYGDKWRIYYATRNNLNQSNISYFEVVAGEPSKILYVHHSPILTLGQLGTFDESGLMPVSVVDFKNKKYLYYVGWSLKKTVPYHNTIGLALSSDNGKSFEKYGEGPIFDLTPFEPYSNGTINIIIENGVWKAWYQSITKWEKIDNRLEPFYHIKYAESPNGIVWERKGIVAIDYKDKNEGGIVSASILKEEGLYKMWYAYRKASYYRENRDSSYRIGYAESKDGIIWKRKDQLAGIDVSNEGWDSEMITYPNVCKFKGLRFMFYNGNGFGSSGIGYAISK